MEKDFIKQIMDSHLPIPMCMVSKTGKILMANKEMDKVFPYADIEEADFFALTGLKIKDMETADEAEDAKEAVIERNGRKFAVSLEKSESAKDGEILVFFHDVTGFEELKKKYDDEKICVCRINIDNYDLLAEKSSRDSGADVIAEANKMIRAWADGINASVDRLRDHLYVVHFQGTRLAELMEEGFALLDEVREIETGTDFPLSISMGVGVGGENIGETAEMSIAALDLALARGGDQAVVNNAGEIGYFGGRTQSVERNNKGKSRIVGVALQNLIKQANRVLIMGHKHADVDSFGSALGIYRICAGCGTEAHIVIDEVPDSLKALYDQVKAQQTYNIIGTAKAEALADQDTLIVVVDTSRPSYIENPALLEKTQQVAVIDHHRRSEDYIKNPILSYVETYASSAAELVTEMLQYMMERKMLVKLEAEALLAGMYVDTNRFAVRTGVRTFEAAAWLRRAGADTTEVKRFFQTDLEDLKIRSQAVADAEIHPGGIVTSIVRGQNQDAQVINSLVADELLNVRDTKAAFVLGKNAWGATCVSARSLGDVNVQIIMEKLGGGGHLNAAGTQLDREPEEVIAEILALAGELGTEKPKKKKTAKKA